MKKRLLNNWGLKLMSLVIACVLWFLVVQLEDPMDSKTFTNVKVKLTNTELLEAENKVYEVLDNTDVVRVTIRAPRSITDKLTASDIVAEADVSKLTDINTVAISYSVLNADVDYTAEGNHEVVRLSVEEKASKYVTLTPNIIGNAAENFIVGSVKLDQNMIEISGPKSAVEKVGYAGVNIDVTNASNSLSANVDIQLYDKEGSLITQGNIVKQANYAHIEVEVLASKSVPIEINHGGEPAEGYMITGVVQSNPSTVKIAGSLSALSNISKIVVPAERLSVEGADEDVVETINIKEYLPENVRLSDSSAGNIKVTIYVEPIVEKSIEIPVDNVSIINVPEDMDAEVFGGTDGYLLNVKGLEVHVNLLNGENIALTVDLAKWMEEKDIANLLPGTYPVTADIGLPEDITITNPIVINVVITEEEE